MTKMAMGVFSSRIATEDALITLIDNGYDPQDFSIIMKDFTDVESIVRETGKIVSAQVVSGATTGGELEIFTQLGLSYKEAKLYKAGIMKGGILLAVFAKFEEETKVETILFDYGAKRIRTVFKDSGVTEKKVSDYVSDQQGSSAFFNQLQQPRKKRKDRVSE